MASIALRPYQQDSVAAVCRHWQQNPTRGAVIVLPTGAGKTVVLAELCHHVSTNWHGQCLVASHVKELAVQAEATLAAFLGREKVGVWSAGLGRKEGDRPIVVGTVQSLVRANGGLGDRHLLIVDEAHRIPPQASSQYQTLIAALESRVPKMLRVGLTATPYRMDSGSITSEDGPLHDLVHETGVAELVRAGWLSPVEFVLSNAQADLSGVSIQRGDYVASEQEDRFLDTVSESTWEMLCRAGDRRQCLVFCAGVDQAIRVRQELEELGEICVEVHGRQTREQRDASVAAFREGRARWAVNCQVLTEGFDAPGIDLVALMRATISPGLYYQMVGRGFRRADGKQDCLVLDFGGNSLRHGPIGDLRAADAPPKLVPEAEAKSKSKSFGDGAEWMWQSCPECRLVQDAWADRCRKCGHELESKLLAQAQKAAQEAEAREIVSYECEVIGSPTVSPHVKRGHEEAPRTLRVSYSLFPDGIGGPTQVSEWVCIEHDLGSFPRLKAVDWWKKHAGAASYPPEDVEDAVEMIESGQIVWHWPKTVTVERDGRWWRITGQVWNEH